MMGAAAAVTTPARIQRRASERDTNIIAIALIVVHGCDRSGD
jgi:hypothetical protein